MKFLVTCLLVAAVTLGSVSFTFAADNPKNTCKKCGLSNSHMSIICEGSLKDAIIEVNCVSSGIFSEKCYDWKGDLTHGDNRIPLTQFSTAEGKRFNPREYSVKTVRIRTKFSTEWSFFDFSK